MQHDNNRPPTDQARLVLASASPRRAELLRTYGYRFETVPSPIEEPQNFSPDVPPAAQAQALSYFKARSVRGACEQEFIIGGDTVVAAGGEVYGKPADRADARRILEAVLGTTHEVITGVTILDAKTLRRHIASETTSITMRAMTEEELEAYLDTGAWEGKAGAYGIQDHGDAFVERIEGSYTNVVGMPMELLGRMLSEWGIEPHQPSHKNGGCGSALNC